MALLARSSASHPGRDDVGVRFLPCRAWNLPMDPGERAARFRFVVRDRAGQFTDRFDAVLSAAGGEDPAA
jgi:hypothetical protein